MLPQEAYYALELDDLQYQLFMLQRGSMLSNFLMMLPGLILSALSVAALWITFASGKNHSDPYLKTSGFSILKVLQILGIVGYALLALLLVILLVIVLVAAASVSGSYAGDAVGAVMGMLAVILLALLAVIALLIVYSAKVIGSLNAAKHAVETGVFQKKASMFVAVLRLHHGRIHADRPVSARSCSGAGLRCSAASARPARRSSSASASSTTTERCGKMTETPQA